VDCILRTSTLHAVQHRKCIEPQPGSEAARPGHRYPRRRGFADFAARFFAGVFAATFFFTGCFFAAFFIDAGLTGFFSVSPSMYEPIWASYANHPSSLAIFQARQMARFSLTPDRQLGGGFDNNPVAQLPCCTKRLSTPQVEPPGQPPALWTSEMGEVASPVSWP
jgi:hypothetical protein